MIRTRRLAESVFLLGCLFAFGAWLCEGALWLPLRQFLLKHTAFAIFRGKSESLFNLLTGNAIGAMGFSFGFLIDYFGQKKELESDLVDAFLYLRKKCANRIFGEQNAYDFQNDEVEDIMEYLSDKKYLILNYRPRCLLLKAKIKRMAGRFRKADKIAQTQNAYMKENVYGLISSVLGSFFTYFGFIYSHQTTIAEIDHSIEFCKKQIESLEKSELECGKYKTQHAILNIMKKGYTNRLISRFPFNTKASQPFMDKQELYKRIYAINTSLTENGKSFAASDLGYLLFSDEFIVKDKEIFYDVTDSEIQVYPTPDKIAQEKQTMGYV